MITLTFLVFLVCLAALARSAWHHARTAIRKMATARSRAAIGDHGSAARSLA